MSLLYDIWNPYDFNDADSPENRARLRGRLERDRQIVRISERMKLASGGVFEEDLVRNVEAINRRISTVIREHTDQWVWMHERWKRQPENPKWADVPSIEKVG